MALLPLRTWRPYNWRNIPNLAIWLDANDATTVTLSGSNVSSWADKSGNGNHAAQATSSKQPLYVASAINGKPALQGRHDVGNTASQLVISYSASYAADNFTGFVVYQRSEDTGTDESILCRYTGTGIYRLRLVSDAPQLFSTNSGAATGASTVALTTPTVTSFRHRNNTSLDIVVGSAVPVVDNAITALPSATTAFELFSQNSAVPFDGYIGEVLMYTRALSDPERASVYRYLKNKWGL